MEDIIYAQFLDKIVGLTKHFSALYQDTKNNIYMYVEVDMNLTDPSLEITQHKNFAELRAHLLSQPPKIPQVVLVQLSDDLSNEIAFDQFSTGRASVRIIEKIVNLNVAIQDTFTVSAKDFLKRKHTASLGQKSRVLVTDDLLLSGKPRDLIKDAAALEAWAKNIYGRPHSLEFASCANFPDLSRS